MSTAYGKIVLRDQSHMEVEAFGVSGCVKLVPGQSWIPEGGFAIDDPSQIDELISLLEIARDHVWSSDRFYQVFYRRDLGSFVSYKMNLSDLDGVYLEAAVENMRSIGKEPPKEVLERLKK